MNLRRVVFWSGGCGLIALALACRLGLLPGPPGAARIPRDRREPARMTERRSSSPPAATRPPAPARSPAPAPAAQATAARPPVPPTPSAAVVSGKAPSRAAGVRRAGRSRATKEELNPLGLGDPFAYSANGAGDYAPLAEGRSAGMITVKGIINLEGQVPMAILELKGGGRSYYVKKGDVIRVDAGDRKQIRSETYIVVRDVRNDEVELVQQERPDRIIIVR